MKTQVSKFEAKVVFRGNVVSLNLLLKNMFV